MPKKVFTETYFKSLENVRKAKELFGTSISINFVRNNYQKTIEKIIVDVDDIDNLLPKKYNLTELERLLDD